MDLDGNVLLAQLFVGLIGFALLVYGRKQTRAPQLICGVLLSIFPYFVPGALPVLGIAAVLVGLMALAVRLGW
jgi:hypothetical protein